MNKHMNKLLMVILIITMVSTDGMARAGKSYSRSTGFTSRPAPVYKPAPAPVYRPTPAPTMAKPVYTPKPVYKPTPTVAPVAHPVAPTAPAVHPTAPAVATPVATSTHTTINRTTIIHRDGGGNGYGNNGGNYGNNGGGMGIGGTMLGVAGGVVAGNVLTEMLMGDHRNAGYAPVGGYASTPQGYPVAGQPVAPAIAGATTGNYVTDGKGGIVPAPISSENPTEMTTGTSSGLAPTGAGQPVMMLAPEEENHTFLKFLGYAAGAIISIWLIFWLIGKYKTWTARKNEIKEMLELEHNLTKFKEIFMTVQNSYSQDLNSSLIQVTNKDMYNFIKQTKDKNEDQGLTNIMEDIEIHSMVTMKNWEANNKKYQQVKIRFSMIDYTINEKGELEHGSKDKRETAVEYWTFESSNKDVWSLIEMNQHTGYVHQS